MTKKFWKFVTKDGFSPGGCGSIKYTTGKTLEVEDANPDKSIQCSSGIHCIDFSEKEYDYSNIIFGPKVAILEVDEKDIIYFKEGSKCRVKKAKVLEVKEPELWMKTGNGDVEWTFKCSYSCGHHPDVMQVIINNKDSQYAYYYANDILQKHDERLMQVIINNKSIHYAYHYSIDVIEGHDERLMQVILDAKDSEYAYLYAKHVLQGHEEKLMQVIIDAQDACYAYDYANDIIEGHDERLMQIIIDQKNPYYAYHYARYVLKGHDERLMKIANNDFSYKYHYEKNILNKEKQSD